MTKDISFTIVLGTRPEVIKLAPVMRELDNRSMDYTFIHTGQHWDSVMSSDIISDLNIKQPDVLLELGEITGGLDFETRIKEMSDTVTKYLPDAGITIVQGDTLSVMAGAIASKLKPNMHLAHVEAGLRSRDYRMPEEHIRIMVDHLSDLLFVPTEYMFNDVENEISSGWITGETHIVGNTVVDMTLENIVKAEETQIGRHILDNYGLEPDDYVFMTMHRAENLSDGKIVDKIMSSALRIYEETGKRILFSMHPNTINKFKQYSREYSYLANLIPDSEEYLGIISVNAVSSLECLYLQNNAAVVLTDSGGLQEESCTLGVPCLTLRESTERPETVKVGSNKLVKLSDIESLSQYVNESLSISRNWQNPYGDGNTSQQIVDLSLDYLERSENPIKIEVPRKIPFAKTREYSFPKFAFT